MEKRVKIKLLILIVCMLIATALGNYMGLSSIAEAKRAKKIKEAELYGQSIANAIQLTLDNTLEASESLKYFYVQYGEEFFKDFDEIAANISKDNPVIGSMYIAPDAVIKVAYPSDVNESTIGFRMLEDPEQGPRAQLAITTQKITVAGPHDLIEGGVGFIIRNPVFIDGKFKGFTIIVLDWDLFVEQIRSNTTASSEKYNYAIWKNDFDETAVTDNYGYIFRSSEGSVSDKVDIEFEVPNDTWHIVVEPKNGWSVLPEMILEISMTLVISTIVMGFVIFVFISSENKKKLLKELAENEVKQKYMDQLSDALEKAKKADAAKTSFLSKMSHDIRTPLNGIIGLIEIGEKHPDDRKMIDENRVKAKVAATHLLSLISDVLDLSKMDDENVHLGREAFDVIELARDVLTITELRASEAGITLEFDKCADEIKHRYVFGSPLHVRQILINILGNSIKYNKPNGHIFCKLKELGESDNKTVLQATISDTGIGMSEEFMEHMFEPFSQEHSDARSVYQGTGLGMAIVKALIEKMGGSVDVTSKVGEGTTFVITIPFEIASEADMPEKIDSSEKDVSGINILLVEDNELNREIAVTILEDVGAHVDVAENGAEAVLKYEKAKVGEYDLILMDLMMPILDGFGATKAIRSSSKTDSLNVPIVAMTANAFEEDVRKCTEAGMNGHLSKPIEIKKLMDVLVKYKR